jgi:hypothetical protein
VVCGVGSVESRAGGNYGAVNATVGSADVCSIWGDDPAKDYRLEEGHRPRERADTLRLCDDCVEIRRSMGDPFLPLIRRRTHEAVEN